MIDQYLDFTKIFIEVEFKRDHDPIEIQNILFYEEKFNLFVLILGLQMKPKCSKLTKEKKEGGGTSKSHITVKA